MYGKEYFYVLFAKGLFAKGLRVKKKSWHIPVFYKISFVIYVVVRSYAKEYEW